MSSLQVLFWSSTNIVDLFHIPELIEQISMNEEIKNNKLCYNVLMHTTN